MAREIYIYDDYGIYLGKVDRDDYIYDHLYRYAGRIDFGGLGVGPRREPVREGPEERP